MAVVSRALADRLAKLQYEAKRCRTQAIVLNAKLALLEAERGELHAMRVRLAAQSARLDHAVDDIVSDVSDVNDAPDAGDDDVTACERPPRASPRP